MSFKLIMISAMYENGGNTTHRFLDGHPQLFVYPFESQPGTPLISDYLSSVFPLKYRWPDFSLSGDFASDYELIIDEELKRHVKTPFASKFKEAEMKLNDKKRKEIFLKLLKNKPRNRANIIEAFFISTFAAWEDYNKTGKEIAYVGYSPIIGVDADKILKDFPNCQMVHVIRNPYSAFADTKKRPVPYSLSKYIHIWNIVQLTALTYADMFPKNFHIVKFEDLVKNPKSFFSQLVKKIGIAYSSSLEYPSWNGKRLDKVVPWGTIMTPSTEANKQTKEELTENEKKEIRQRSIYINKILGYDRL